MFRNLRAASKMAWIAFVVFTFLAVHAPGYSQQGNRTLVITGQGGEAAVIQKNGRAYVEISQLAELVNGTIEFRGKQILLTMPNSYAGASANMFDGTSSAAKFSREFVRAAIESLGTMREWGSTLAQMIQSGYPIGNSMTDYRGRAATSVSLARAAVSTESDRKGLELLALEFENLQSWSNNLVQARNTMNSANLSMSPGELQRDPVCQKVLRCWEFLGAMFGSGRFEDDGSCR